MYRVEVDGVLELDNVNFVTSTPKKSAINGVFKVVVRDLHDAPQLRILQSTTQSGLSTQGGDIVGLIGLNMGLSVWNADMQIYTRYGQGNATVFETQILSMRAGSRNASAEPRTYGTLSLLGRSVAVPIAASALELKAALLSLPMGDVVQQVEVAVVDSIDNEYCAQAANVTEFVVSATGEITTVVSESVYNCYEVKFGLSGNSFSDDTSQTVLTYGYGYNLPPLEFSQTSDQACTQTDVICVNEAGNVVTVVDGDPGSFKGDDPNVDTTFNASDSDAEKLYKLNHKIFRTDDCTVSTDFTAVQCTTVPGFGLNLLWQISIDGQTSNIIARQGEDMAYAPPTILEFLGDGRSDALTRGGETVIIKGTQFGLQEHNAVISVRYGLTGEEYTISNPVVTKNHTELTCIMKGGFGGTLKWVIDVANQLSLTPTTSYAKPEIFQLTGDVLSSTEGNDVVTISGNNFGPANSDAILEVTYGKLEGTLVQTPFIASNCSVQISHLQIVCQTVPGTGTDFNWFVKVDTLASEASGNTTSYGAPHIDINRIDVGTQRATGGEQTVKVYGSNFGSNVAKLFFNGGDISVSYATETDQPNSPQYLSIVRATPQGTGKGNTIVVTVSGQTSNTYLYDYDRPSAVKSGMNVVEGTQNGVKKIRLAGSDFGPAYTRSAQACPTAASSESRWNVTARVGYAPNGDFVPTLALLFTTKSNAITFIAGDPDKQLKNTKFAAELPHQDACVYTCAAYSPTGDPDVRCADVGCDPNTELCFETEALVGWLVVVVDNQTLAAPLEYNFEEMLKLKQPTITVITRATEGSSNYGSTAGKEMVTITGTNFGNSGGVQVGFFEQIDGESEFKDCNIGTEWPGTSYERLQVICSMPPGHGQMSVRVFAAFTVPTLPREYKYNEPSITDVQPRNGSTTGGELITVTGDNFSPFCNRSEFQSANECVENSQYPKWGSGPQVWFKWVTTQGERQATVISFNRTAIVCLSPAGRGAGLRIEVRYPNSYPAVVGVPGSLGDTTTSTTEGDNIEFSYMRPTITSTRHILPPDDSKNSDAGVLYLYGENFGCPENVIGPDGNAVAACPGSLAFTFDSKALATPIHIYNSSFAEFKIPAGVGTHKDMALTVFEQEVRFNFSYPAPVITQVEPNPFFSNKDTLTITGMYFGPEPGSPDITVEIYQDHGGLELDNEAVAYSEPLQCVATTESPVYSKPYQLVCSTDERNSEAEANKGGMHAIGKKSLRASIGGQWSNLYNGRNRSTEAHCGARNETCGNNLGVKVPGSSKEDVKSLCYPIAANSRCMGRDGPHGQKQFDSLEAHCRAGYFRDRNAAKRFDGSVYTSAGPVEERCTICPDQAKCEGGTLEPVADARYWLVKNDNFEYSYIECSPPDSCQGGGHQECATGYMLDRCAQCCDGTCTNAATIPERKYYRDPFSNTCTECPEGGLILMLGLMGGVGLLGYGGYQLHRRGPNMATLNIGVDYFQVLSMFANLKFEWPGYVKETLEYTSIMMGGLELTSPECSVSFSYYQKWVFLQALPIMVLSGMFVMHCVIVIKKTLAEWKTAATERKRARAKSSQRGDGNRRVSQHHLSADEFHDKHEDIGTEQKKNKMNHVPQMISTFFAFIYFLFIFLTKTTLQVFSCETNAAGASFLKADPVVPCYDEEHTFYRGVGALSLLTYSFGIPVLITIILYKNRKFIKGSQEMLLEGKGASKELNYNYYIVRKKYGKLYQFFKPEYFYWVVCVLLRKLFVSLIISGLESNPLFAASSTALVLFMCQTQHIMCQPYLSPTAVTKGSLLGDDATKSVGGDELQGIVERIKRERDVRHQRVQIPKGTKPGQSFEAYFFASTDHEPNKNLAATVVMPPRPAHADPACPAGFAVIDVPTDVEARFRIMKLPLAVSKDYGVPVFSGSEGRSQKSRMFLYDVKERMMCGRPADQRTLVQVRNELTEHRYLYLQSLVLFNYNTMEKRFLESSIFVLISGVMFHSVAMHNQPADNSESLILGTMVMFAVGGTTAYFFGVMFVEITKYVYLFNSVKQWESGQSDDGMAAKVDKLKGKAQGGPIAKLSRKFQVLLLPAIYKEEIKEKKIQRKAEDVNAKKHKKHAPSSSSSATRTSTDVAVENPLQSGKGGGGGGRGWGVAKDAVAGAAVAERQRQDEADGGAGDSESLGEKDGAEASDKPSMSNFVLGLMEGHADSADDAVDSGPGGRLTRGWSVFGSPEDEVVGAENPMQSLTVSDSPVYHPGRKSQDAML